MNREEALEILHRVRPELEARGVVHAGLFGSVARGEAGPRSDVDVVVRFNGGTLPDLFNLGGVQVILEEAFVGLSVDVEFEPINNDSLRQAIDRDRAVAF
jgi:predicted nucleotidyltransferase